MDVLYTAQLSIPLHQIALLLILSTFALLFGKVKLALLTNYLFTMYWGYFFNRDLMMNYLGNLTYFTAIYFGLGLFIVVLAMIGFLAHRN